MSPKKEKSKIFEKINFKLFFNKSHFINDKNTTKLST